LKTTLDFQKRVEKIFSTPFPISSKADVKANNCFSALFSPGFNVFTSNFFRRLDRLARFFRGKPKTIKEILSLLSQISTTRRVKWSGPYSELVALDYLSRFPNLRDLTYICKGPVQTFEDSLAKKAGRQEVDIDVSFKLDFTRVFGDVKSLIPTHYELFEIVIDKIQEAVGHRDFLLGVDEVAEVECMRIKEDLENELSKGTLVSSLVTAINEKAPRLSFTLKSGFQIIFKMSYKEPGKTTSLITTQLKDPQLAAANYEYKVLNYYVKPLTQQPSIIIFVTHPWFNRETNDPTGFTQRFFRAFSRRVRLSKVPCQESVGKSFALFQKVRQWVPHFF